MIFETIHPSIYATMTTIQAPSASIQSEIDLLTASAAAAFKGGKIDDARAMCEEALTRSIACRYSVGKGDALIVKGKIFYRTLLLDEAFAIFQEVLDIFQDVGDARKIAIALQGLGSFYYSRGRLLEALEEFLNAYSILDLADLAHETLPVLGNIVIIYHTMGEYAQAIFYAERQLAFAKKFSLEDQTAKALSSLGELYFRMSDFTTSLQYSTEGLAIAEHCGDRMAASSILGNISSVYFHLGNYTGALDYTMRSIAQAELIGMKRLLPSLFNYACCIYGKMNNDSLALSYAMRALEISASYSDPVGEASTLHNIACIFEQNSDFETALEYAHKSYHLFSSSSVKDGSAETLLLMSRCNEKLGDSSQALTYAHKAMGLAEEIDSYSLIQSSLRQLQSCATHNGDTQSAAQYARRLQDTSKIIAKVEQRKNAEKILLDAQIQKTRQQAEQLLNSAKTSLTGDFLTKTYSLKQQGFVLTTVTPPEVIKKQKAAPGIRIQTFGHFSVMIGDRELTSDDWQRKKARDIFKILLLNHRKSVSADELIDILWLDAAGKNLIPTLWNCVSYIRKALEPSIKPRQPSAYIKIVGKNYMLDLGAGAEIDFLTFRNLVSKAPKQSTLEAQIRMYEQAITLYTGEFLKEDSFEDWSSFERESLKELYINTVTTVGNYYLSQGNTTQATLHARKILDIDRVQDDGYELLFTSLAAAGNISELAKSWALCQAAYRREFLSHPPKHLAALAGDI